MTAHIASDRRETEKSLSWTTFGHEPHLKLYPRDLGEVGMLEKYLSLPVLD